MSLGVVQAIHGLIVDVEFDDELPTPYEVLTVENGHNAQLLVQRIEPSRRTVCLNINGDNRIQRGMTVEGKGKSIEIPVGDQLIGRVLDALCRPIDGEPPIDDGLLEKRNIFIPALTHQTYTGENIEI
ncbi:hypothetical protein M1512_02955, partial [Patescibacteria group bacterium]|nr:hypothetical protein [Patescibacteria group bacterium]